MSDLAIHFLMLAAIVVAILLVTVFADFISRRLP